ncbi:MAG: FGGY-family carbohydrate kinase [Spirochaetaceae bacterium]|nr:FGGY-family carbohydrate kinase [Spirochaetaceae bacterium]
MSNLLFGLDYGTGGAKGCLIDDQGQELAYSFKEYPIIQRYPSWSEHNSERYWEIACEIIRECISTAGIDSSEIKAVAVSAALPSLVMIDEHGKPLQNAYNLMDRRATKEVQWLKDTIGEEKIFRITANRLDDHPTIANLLWERNNRNTTYKAMFKALTVEGFIVYKLTGETTLVHSNAGFMGVAYNIVEKRFETDLLDRIGIDPEIMPSLHYCEEIVGGVTKRASDETGLAPGTPVAAGQADFNASCLSVGIIEEGDCQMNLGTCGVLGFVHKDPRFMFEMIALGFTVHPKDTYMAIGATQTGGMSLRYIRDNLSQYEVQIESASGISAYDLLNLQAEKCPAGSEGLVILPFLTGEKTPIWDPHVRGCVFGLSLHHTKGHIIRAMMEGVAYALYDSFRLFQENNAKINVPIVMNEGGTRSRLWRQIITDVFDVPTVFAKRRSGAPFGNAILAGVSVGVLPGYSVCKKWAEYVDPIEPSPQNHSVYMDYFGIFKELYDNNRDTFRTLAHLRDCRSDGE